MESSRAISGNLYLYNCIGNKCCIFMDQFLYIDIKYSYSTVNYANKTSFDFNLSRSFFMLNCSQCELYL